MLFFRRRPPQRYKSTGQTTCTMDIILVRYIGPTVVPTRVMHFLTNCKMVSIIFHVLYHCWVHVTRNMTNNIIYYTVRPVCNGQPRGTTKVCVKDRLLTVLCFLPGLDHIFSVDIGVPVKSGFHCNILYTCIRVYALDWNVKN